MADRYTSRWQMSRQMAAATSQQLGSSAHQSDQLYPVLPHEHWQVPAQPQPQSQPYQYQATGSSSLNNVRPNENINNLNTILSHFLESLNFLKLQQRYVNEALVKSDSHFEALLSSVSSIRETVDGLTKKLDAHDGIKEKLEPSSRGEDKNVKEIDVIKVLVGEMKAFKKTLGKSCDGDDGRTVLGRLDAVTFAVGELLERARDPEANRQLY